MAETRSIVCEDCGAQYPTRRPNTKYCAVCRLRKDLLFLKTTTRACWDCGAAFAPIHSDDVLCTDCEKPKRRYGEGPCNVCDEPDTTLLIPGLRICTRCLRDGRQRPRIMELLRLRIAWEKKQNGVTA